MSRIQAERIHCIQETRATERLDMEQFQPMMTSEPRQPQHAPAVLVTSARTRRPRGKRECAVEELDEEGVRVPRKRERRWGLANNSYFSCISYTLFLDMFYAMQCVTRGSDYGSLSTLGSSLLKLDLIEPGTGPDTKLEVLGQLFEIFQVCVLNPDTIIIMQSKLRDCNRSNKLLTDCLTFRRTMTQLRKQTLTLVKVMTTLL